MEYQNLTTAQKRITDRLEGTISMICMHDDKGSVTDKKDLCQALFFLGNKYKKQRRL